MEEKMNEKKLQGAKAKREIIESADPPFLEYGFENVSVDSIVEKAGISKGGLLRAFRIQGRPDRRFDRGVREACGFEP